MKANNEENDNNVNIQAARKENEWMKRWNTMILMIMEWWRKQWNEDIHNENEENMNKENINDNDQKRPMIDYILKTLLKLDWWWSQ